MKSEIKYVELKTDGVRGVARIARVELSKTERTVYYDGRTLIALAGHSAKANFRDEDTDEEFWISSPRRDGSDSLVAGVVEIDDDVREEYWLEIRRLPSRIGDRTYRSPGVSKRRREALEKAVRRHDMDRRFKAP